MKSSQISKYLTNSFDWKTVSSTLTEYNSFFRSRDLFAWKWINSVLSTSNYIQFCFESKSRSSANFCNNWQFSSIDFDETANSTSST